MYGAFSAVIGVAVLIWVLYNQVRVREFTPRRVRIAGILGVVGVVQLVQAAGTHPVSTIGWALLITGLVIGAVLGVVRATTVNLWVADGRVWTQGHWLTVVLWLVSVGAHVGLDLLAGAVAPSAGTANSSSIVLFIALSLGAQALVTMQRAQSLPGAPAMSMERAR